MGTVIAASDTFIHIIPSLTTQTDRSYTLNTCNATNTAYAQAIFHTEDASLPGWRHQQSPIAARRTLTGHEFMGQLYREGKLLNLPHPQPLSPEEQAEREQLAQRLTGGKSMSAIISEGRGSY